MPNSRSKEQKRINKAFEILEILGVSKVAHNLAGNISGGQSKLVDIARAMMSEPDIILLDEPTSFLDKQNESKIFSFLKKIKKNKIIIVTSHKASHKKIFDKLIFL